VTATDAHREIDAVWRIESPRLIASLARIVRLGGTKADQPTLSWFQPPLFSSATLRGFEPMFVNSQAFDSCFEGFTVAKLHDADRLKRRMMKPAGLPGWCSRRARRLRRPQILSPD